MLPRLDKKTYRYIAEITNVALCTVGWVLNDLINLGFVVEMGDRGRQLLKREELFNRILYLLKKLKEGIYYQRK